MKHLHLCLFALLVSITVLAVSACDGARPAGGWWRYGLAGSSPFWAQLHQYDEDPTSDGRLLVAITVFSDESHAIHYTLDRDGLGLTERDEKKGAFRRPSADVQKVRNCLNDLVPDGPYPPIPRLIIVRWHQGGTWVTARFDRDEQPVAMQDLARAVTGHNIGDITP